MAITDSLALRNAKADEVNTLTNAGTTNAAGAVVFMTSGDVEVATMRMSNPAFGAASGGAVTANAITNDPDATGGVAALFKVVDRDDNEVYRGTLGLDGSGADLEADPAVTSLTIGADDEVAVGTLIYTA